MKSTLRKSARLRTAPLKSLPRNERLISTFSSFSLSTKGLIRQDKAVRKQSLRLPSNLIGFTREEQFVQ